MVRVGRGRGVLPFVLVSTVLTRVPHPRVVLKARKMESRLVTARHCSRAALNLDAAPPTVRQHVNRRAAKSKTKRS